MRITGGELKGRQLHSGFANHVRPSTDRVRESLFNSLQNQINLQESNVLDLFSGSGIIALEFLSRYAPKVLSIDLDKKNIQYQKFVREEWRIPYEKSALKHKHISKEPKTAHNTFTTSTITSEQALAALGNWDIIMADVWKYIPKLTEQFDIIFADPPYHMPNLQELPGTLLPRLNKSNPDALLLIEHKPQIQFQHPHLPTHTKDYGSSIISFFKL